MKKSYLGLNFSAVILLLLTLCISNNANAQIISTVAGLGTGGYTGDGGAATAARLQYPTGMCTDASGNLFIADALNNCVRKVNTSGVISTVAGTGTGGYSGDGGPATSAMLQTASAIALDASGNLLIVDAANNRIRKVNTSGTISTIAGTGAAGFSGDGGAATAAKLDAPWGIVLDGSGGFYFSDRNNHRVRQVNASGIINTVAGNGTGAYAGDYGPATAASLNTPGGLALDASGNLFIADINNYRVRVVSSAGLIVTIAGNGSLGFSGDGGPGTAAKLYHPYGVALDPSDTILYIADRDNTRIRVLTMSGTINTYAGTGTSGYSGDGGAPTAAKIAEPMGVFVDHSGALYIADEDNHRIRKVTPCVLPHVAPIAGSSSICVGASAPLTDSIASGTWSSGATAIATVSATGTVTGVSVGTAVITYSVSNSCGAAIQTLTITVGTVPVVAAITGVDSVCPGHTDTLSETSAGGIWSSSNNTIATVSATGIVTGVTTGYDTIKYILTTACGSDTATYPIKVRSHASCSVGTENIAGNAFATGISVFPNPNHGVFDVTITSPVTENIAVVVTNLLGQRVTETHIISNKETAMPTQLPAGMYFISAIVNGQRYTSRIIVE